MGVRLKNVDEIVPSTGSTLLQVTEGLRAKSYQESYVDVSASSIDCSSGNYFNKTMSGALTLTFDNPPPSGAGYGFILEVVSDGSAITWPSSVRWPSATAPELPAAGETSIYVFLTKDGGTSWNGFLGGSAMGV